MRFHFPTILAIAVEDGVARAIGVNDRDFVIVGNRPGVRVTFDQEKRGAGVWGVEIVLGREAL